jgi:hypothetical protein
MKTGQDLLELAATRIGEEYVYGADVPIDNPNRFGFKANRQINEMRSA